MEDILLKIYRNKFFKVLRTTPTPRWVVLFVDIALVAIGFTLLIISDYFKTGGELINELLPVKFILLILVYFLMSVIIKSYQCIIRLSVMEDLYRVFLLVFSSSCILFFINAVYAILEKKTLFSYWNIFIIACITFTLLLFLRLSVKYIYMKFNTTGDKRKPIIVLGSALNSFVLASALKNENGGKFVPVALLSIAGKHKNKVNGIPIETFNPDTVVEIFQKYNTNTLVFLSTQIELMRSGFADHFLKNDISLLLLNQVEEFDVNDENKSPAISKHIKNIQIEDLLGRDPINNENPLINELICDQTVLITGAAGSIGSELVRQIASCKAKEIILIDQAETPMHNIQLEMEEKFPESKILLFIGDVQNKTRMEQAFARFKPRFVFHAAAYKHVPMMENNPTEAILTNIYGTKNIADLSLKYGVYKFVMISTDKAVNPTNIMGATKRIAEIYVQSLFFHNLKSNNKNATQFITTRFGNVLGSNGSVIPRFRHQIETGGPVTVTHKDIIRYFMTIKEACSLVLEAGCMGNGGEIYIFDMGSPVKIYDLACRMITLAGLKVNKDIKIIETGLRPGEKLFEELLNKKKETMATVNKKIMIAKVQQYNYTDVCEKLEEIISTANSGNTHNAVLLMKILVPEYKSMNSSQFEAIDKELNVTVTS
jgi:possible capsular polysaccharide biosynthesis protein